MTTYIVNGNSTSPSITLDGFTENIDEQFIIITNNKCPVPYLKTITELTNSHNQIHHHKIASSKKKWFMSYIKNIYRNYLAEETDKVVIMPSTTITGASVEAYVGEGKVSIVPNYKFYKSDSTTIPQDMNWSDMLINNTNTGGRIHILIDYENVNNSGLDGTEYLTKNDYVTLFYSHSSGTIQQGYFDGLINNSGSFNIVKLSQTRKNALDYYIAIRVGEIIKEYPNEKLLIVSKDKGYYAVLEYCESLKT